MSLTYRGKCPDIAGQMSRGHGECLLHRRGGRARFFFPRPSAGSHISHLGYKNMPIL